MIKTLQSKMTQATEKATVLQEFQSYVREGDASHIKRNFKYVRRDFMVESPSRYSVFRPAHLLITARCFRKVLKTLLDSLSNDSKAIQVEVLQTLIDMLKCSELVESFSFYPELLILKVIYAYKSDDQKVDASSGSGGRSPVSYHLA